MLDQCDTWRIENPNIKMLLDLLSVPDNSGLPRFLLKSPGLPDFFCNLFFLISTHYFFQGIIFYIISRTTVKAKQNFILLPLMSSLIIFIYVLLRWVPNNDISLHYTALVVETQAIVIVYAFFPKWRQNENMKMDIWYPFKHFSYHFKIP